MGYSVSLFLCHFDVKGNEMDMEWMNCSHKNGRILFYADEESERMRYVMNCIDCNSQGVVVEEPSDDQLNQLVEETFSYLEREIEQYAELLVKRTSFINVVKNDSPEFQEWLTVLTSVVDQCALLGSASRFAKEIIGPDKIGIVSFVINVTREYDLLTDMDIHSMYYMAWFASMKNITIPTEYYWEPKFKFPPTQCVYEKEEV